MSTQNHYRQFSSFNQPHQFANEDRGQRRGRVRRRRAIRQCRFESLEARCLLATAPLDEQFLVAEVPGFESSASEVVVHADGGFTVAWETFEEDGDGFGVFAQRFGADALPASSRLQLSDGIAANHDQTSPTLAADADGNVLVVWASKGQDGDGWGIYGRWIPGDGSGIGAVFLVNSGIVEEQSLTVDDQRAPAVAMTTDGTAMIVWQSQGQDGDGWGIFYSLLDQPGDTTPQVGRVNLATTGTQQAPDVASSGGNQFVVVWEAIDPLGGAEASLDVYGRLFDATGVGAATEFKVNTGSLRDQVTPTVSMNPAGDFVVAWVSEGIPGSGSDVFAQRFEADAAKFGDEFRVNDTTLASQVAPAITLDPDGNCFVVWQSVHQDGFSEGVIGRVYGPNGETLYGEFIVNEKIEGPQTKPAIAGNEDGLAVVTWFTKDELHGPAIAAQRFQMPGLNPTFRVGVETQLVTVVELPESSPSAALSPDGRSLVAWDAYDQDGSGLGVYAQRLDEYGEALGASFLVNVEATLGHQYAPAVATSASGISVIAWQGESGTENGYDIYAQRVDRDGNLLGTAILVNTTLTGDQTSPDVAMDDSGNFVVTWEGEVEGEAAEVTKDIFARRFDSQGTPLDALEQPVNWFTGLDQVMPTVAMNAAGEYAIAWVSSHPALEEEEIDAEKSVFVQWYSAAGIATEAEVLVHNHVKDAQESPDIGLDAAGNFVVTWQSINQDGSTWGVYARQFTADKSPVQEDEFLVNVSTQGLQRSASVGVEANGRFVIAWQNMSHELDDGSSWEIYRREYSADGEPETGEIQVNTWTEGPQTTPVVARTPTGNYGIFWQGQGLGHVDGVHGRLYDISLIDDPGTPSRVPIGDQFLVGETLGFENSPPAVAISDGGSFVVAFESLDDDGSGFGILTQWFDSSGLPQLETPVVANSETYGDQSSPAVALSPEGRALVVWQSQDEGGDGFDIYGQWILPDGSLFESQFLVSGQDQAMAGDQTAPEVAIDALGNVLIVFQSDANDGAGTDIYYSYIPAESEPGAPMRLNVEIAGDQLLPSVAVAKLNDERRFLVAWQGPGVSEEGEASIEIFARYLDHNGVPAGAEFPVNVETLHDQISPKVAMNDAGEGVIVWQAEGQRGSGSDVYGRQIDSLGNLADEEFRVNVTTTRPQRMASVAIDDSGRFLVSWQSQYQDGFSWGIFGRAFANDGSPLTDEYQVNSRVSGPQTSAMTVANGGGQAMVTWLGNDAAHHPTVFGQRYLLSAAEEQLAVGGELSLAGYHVIEETPPAAAMNASRESVVAWTSYAEDGSGLGVFAQMLDASGLPMGSKFQVSTAWEGNQARPAVARAPDGRFVIAWTTDDLDGSGRGVFAQIYEKNGTPFGGNFQVNSTFLGDQYAPSVAMSPDGSFVVVWQGDGPDGTQDIFGQRYTAAGDRIGGEMPVNHFTSLDQKDPAVAINSSGTYVVTWVSDHPATTDPNDTEKSVFARVFDASGAFGAPEVLVHRYVKDAQEAPAVGIDASGRFVVAWQSINQDGNAWGVFARRFDVDMTPLDRREMVVNEARLGPQRYVGVGVDEYGRYVVVWQSNSHEQEGSSWDIYSRQYSFDGAREGGEIAVNQWNMGPQILPVVAQAPGGDFGVFWLGQGPGHIEGVHGRLYQSLFDFGDAPDPLASNAGEYPTRLATDGARHLPGSRLFLGAGVDVELEGQPDSAATGDDANGSFDDEDGVMLPSSFVARLGATVSVTVSAPGKLDGWIDFDRDGVFEANEKIFDSVTVSAGVNLLPVQVPTNVSSGTTYARFRVSSAGGLGPRGVALDGEVEDYRVQVQALESASAMLVDDPLGSGAKVLLVNGTVGTDNLSIQYLATTPPQVKVTLGSTRVLGTFPLSAFERIVAYGQLGNDTIVVDSRIAKSAELHGDSGNDTLTGGAGNDTLVGGEGNDRLRGNNGDDLVRAGTGSDFVYGGNGDDQLFGEQGSDYLYGDAGNDIVVGGSENDMLNGGRGRDILIGGQGADYVLGNEDDDVLIGNPTVHDADLNSLMAMIAIWRSAATFENRIADLAPFVNRDTVLRDLTRDTLYGGTGRDWTIDYELRDSIIGFVSNPTTGDRKN